jgi:Flp pilus assembly protein TadB
MLALALANAVGALLFGVLYAVAGAKLMPQLAFLVCLGILFALVTTLWVRTEARHRSLGALQRIGRMAFGLVAILVVTPTVVLMPLFWLDTKLPPEAGLAPMLGPIMTLVLISLALVVLVNVVGGVFVVGRALLAGGGRLQ